MKYNTFIFDLDGTLLDTMSAWNELEANFAQMAGVFARG